MAKYVRIWVDVVARISREGEVLPQAIIWPDGREFALDSCTPQKRMRCEHTIGVDALRYECIINGRRRLLYRSDEGRFFVEAKVPEDPEARLKFETYANLGPKKGMEKYGF